MISPSFTYEMIGCIRQVWSEQHFSMSIHRLHLSMVLFFPQSSGLTSKDIMSHICMYICLQLWCSSSGVVYAMIVLVLCGQLSHERLSRVNTLLLKGCPKGLGYITGLFNLVSSLFSICKSFIEMNFMHTLLHTQYRRDWLRRAPSPPLLYSKTSCLLFRKTSNFSFKLHVLCIPIECITPVNLKQVVCCGKEEGGKGEWVGFEKRTRGGGHFLKSLPNIGRLT